MSHIFYVCLRAISLILGTFQILHFKNYFSFQKLSQYLHNFAYILIQVYKNYFKIFLPFFLRKLKLKLLIFFMGVNLENSELMVVANSLVKIWNRFSNKKDLMYGNFEFILGLIYPILDSIFPFNSNNFNPISKIKRLNL